MIMFSVITRNCVNLSVIIITFMITGSSEVAPADTTRPGQGEEREAGSGESSSSITANSYIWRRRLSTECHREIASCRFILQFNIIENEIY